MSENPDRWYVQDFLSLLRDIQFSAGTRKGDLLAIAIARLYWQHFRTRTRELLEHIETRADEYSIPDVAGEELLDLVDADIRQMPEPLNYELELFTVVLCGEWHHVSDAAAQGDLPGQLNGDWEPLVRDVYPNPFRPVAFDPAWRSGTAVSLAKHIYESRDFGAMPILADALQDAGCNSAEVFDHCRGPGPHVRGCWVVDLVLGKG